MSRIDQNLSGYSAQDFNPIPPGKYTMMVTDSQVKDTKTKKRMITISCKVIGPTHQGRIVFDNFVLGNDVAMARLKTLATVGGHPRPDFIQDTEELHGLQFIGNVGIRSSEGYSDQNHIKSFEKIPAPAAQPQQMPQQAQAPQYAQPVPQSPYQHPAMPPAPPAPPTAYPPPPPPVQQQFHQPQYQPPQQMPQQPQAPKPTAPWVK